MVHGNWTGNRVVGGLPITQYCLHPYGPAQNPWKERTESSLACSVRTRRQLWKCYQFTQRNTELYLAPKLWNQQKLNVQLYWNMMFSVCSWLSLSLGCLYRASLSRSPWHLKFLMQWAVCWFLKPPISTKAGFTYSPSQNLGSASETLPESI